jgi:hypothetical protein
MEDNKDTSINSLLNSINSNKQFSRLIIYSLNSLKSHLIIQNQAIENSVKILQSRIFLFRKFYKDHIIHL